MPLVARSSRRWCRRWSCRLPRPSRRQYQALPMILSENTKIGIVNGYRHPAEVGMDRLAKPSAAFILWRAAPDPEFRHGDPARIRRAAQERRDDAGLHGRGDPARHRRWRPRRWLAGRPPAGRLTLAEPERVIGRTTAGSRSRRASCTAITARFRPCRALPQEEIGQSCDVIAVGGRRVEPAPTPAVPARR